MPSLSPFRGFRYNAEGGHVDDVIAPPYDVISEADREALARGSDHNAVHLEVPLEADGLDRYQAAAATWRRWLENGVLAADDEPCFYAYRMGFHDETGRPRQTTGILGALALEPPGTGVLAHERTTPKAAADRLDLLRATRVNLSPIWALSPAAGLSALAETSGPPDARATDREGVHHRLWKLTAPAVLAAIGETVATAPVLIADGHHRYEVAMRYQAEVGVGGGQDAVLTLVVELAEDELSVRAIHRLISGLPDGFDLREALLPYFDMTDAGPVDETILARMVDAGSLALVTPEGASLLRPTAATEAAATQDLDSTLLDVALAGLPPHDLRFQHGWDLATSAVGKGDADAAVLLRPATVAQISEISHGAERMPPKTTFFYPKLATGMVFRSLDP